MGRPRGNGPDLWVRLWRLVRVPFRRRRGGVTSEGTRWSAEPHFVPYGKSGRMDWSDGWFRTKKQAMEEAARRPESIERTEDHRRELAEMEAKAQWWRKAPSTASPLMEQCRGEEAKTS